ncbi:DUF3124 domain-containing protein [Okeania sp. SIO2C9]|uniref:DUF3124 domain-containing protein n=1 Tax=Okeania sp. SIO2C9 TaxID=2607791 RepID=UPI0025FFF925|nr:DUF3124 domain-containing protein [Okeania sp. SIO2C9]
MPSGDVGYLLYKTDATGHDITLLWSCTSAEIVQQPLTQSTQNNTAIAVNSSSPQDTEIILTENLELATGQIIYVPIYSHVYYANQQRIYNLSATLSISEY